MVNEPPTEEVLSLKQQGVGNSDIIEQLKNKGHTYEQISDALTQAEIKDHLEGVPPTPAPSPTLNNPPSDQSMQPSMMSKPPAESPSFAPPVSQPPPQMSRPVAPPVMNSFNSSRNVDERIEEIAEAIVNEKWQKMIEDVGDLSVWKEKMRTNVTSIKQEVLRIEERFDSLQKAVVGKVNEYDDNIRNVGVEIKALEKLLQKIMEPLTRNVSELSRITEKLKK